MALIDSPTQWKSHDQNRIKTMDPVERFLYWCTERHRIYLRRLDQQPKPWTDDPILQQFYFTNVFREIDKTTEWFRTNMRDPLRNVPEVLMATVIFRWFNYIPTGRILMERSLHTNWRPRLVLDLLGAERSAKRQIFTGAFMINSPAGEPKLEAIVNRISNVWERRKELLNLAPYSTMERLHKLLTEFDGLGGFMAYELVCDLRFTYILGSALDILTWANPGPGAIRGMYRVLGRELTNKSNSSAPKVPTEWRVTIMLLREQLAERMAYEFGGDGCFCPSVEAREVEMALCEYDKYVRLLFGEGQSKRRYNGV